MMEDGWMGQHVVTLWGNVRNRMVQLFRERVGERPISISDETCVFGIAMCEEIEKLYQRIDILEKNAQND